MQHIPDREAGELRENALQNQANDIAIRFHCGFIFKGNRRLGTCYSLEGRSLFEIDCGCFRRGFRAKITRMLLD